MAEKGTASLLGLAVEGRRGISRAFRRLQRTGQVDQTVADFRIIASTAKSSTNGTCTSSLSFSVRPMIQYSIRRPNPALCLNSAAIDVSLVARLA